MAAQKYQAVIFDVSTRLLCYELRRPVLPSTDWRRRNAKSIHRHRGL